MDKHDPLEDKIKRTLQYHRENFPQKKMDPAFERQLLEDLRMRQKLLVRTRRLHLVRYATVAAILIAAFGIYFVFVRTEKQFEHTFTNNTGYIKASPGSVVHLSGEYNFKLEKGKLNLKLKNFDKPQELVIQTDEGIVKILETDPDGTVDIEVRKDQDAKTVIKVRAGVLAIANPLDPAKQTKAGVGDIVSVSKTGTVINSIGLIKQDKLFSELYKREPELLESLEEMKKVEWASCIGHKMKENHMLLNAQEKKALAILILQDETVVSWLKGINQSQVSVEEVWLYIEAVHDEKPDIHRSAYRAITLIMPSLEREMLEGLIKVLLLKTGDKDWWQRNLSASALGENIARLSDELIQTVIVTFKKGLEDEHPNARYTFANGLGRVAERLDDTLFEKLVTTLLDILIGKNPNLRGNAAKTLSSTQILKRIDDKLSEEVLRSLITALNDKEENPRTAAVDAITQMVTRLDGQRLDDMLSAVEKALKEEKTENTRLKLNNLFKTLKQRKALKENK